MLAKIMSFLQLAAEKKNMTNKNSTLFISLGLYFELLLVLSSVQNSDFKSQFIMSKITQIILHISFIEEYQSRTTFFENFHFLKQFITKNESNFRRLRSMLFEVVCIKKNVAEFTHSFISSLFKEFIMLCHNLGHPNGGFGT